jgi:hypothetical protein
MARKRSGVSKRNAIDIEADLVDGYKVAGFVTGLATEVHTSRYIGPVVEYAHDRMARAFDLEIDNVARGNEASLGHVYEWRMLGLPEGRLWRHTLTGRGENRQASWSWQQSTMPILTPQERKDADNPDDPISEVDDEDIKELSDRQYVFHWKAPVIEYGLTVNIVAVNAKALFIPSFGAENGFYFAKSSHNQMKSKGTGKFTAFWTNWWANGAAKVWDIEVKRTIERDLGQSKRELAKTTAGRASSKTFSINTIANNEKAFEAGRNYAEAYVKGKAKSYAQAAKYIDRYGKYGDEVNYPS